MIAKENGYRNSTVNNDENTNDSENAKSQVEFCKRQSKPNQNQSYLGEGPSSSVSTSLVPVYSLWNTMKYGS